MIIKRILPKTLLWRLMMILIIPLLLVQLIVGIVFWDRHWTKTTETLAIQISGNVQSMLMLIKKSNDDSIFEFLQKVAEKSYSMKIMRKNASLGFSESSLAIYDWRTNFIADALSVKIKIPYTVIIKKQSILIEVLLGKYIYAFEVKKSMLFPKTTSIVIWWEVGAPLFFMFIAIIFMRNQIRPLRFLSDAVEDFGKGVDNKKFKPTGATEVKKVGFAFNAMRTRIKEQISHRTQMLSGISHDLKTPLTRMQLQIAMLSDKSAAQSLLSDVHEMENMVEEYLSFARGQEMEAPSEINIKDFIESVIEKFPKDVLQIESLDYLGNNSILIKKQSMKRAIKNIILNATRYANSAWLKIIYTQKVCSIVIEDNGPGIPKDKREDVFMPFFRIDDSRNSETGGYGLGLAISKDIVHSHGGSIFLSDSSEYGGLKVTINLPR